MKRKNKNEMLETLNAMIKHADKGPSGFWVDEDDACGNPLIFPEFKEGIKHGEYVSKPHTSCPWDFDIMYGADTKSHSGCYYRCGIRKARFLKEEELRNVLIRFKDRFLNGDYANDKEKIYPLLTENEINIINKRIKQDEDNKNKLIKQERQERAKKASRLIEKYPKHKDLLIDFYGTDAVAIVEGGSVCFSPKAFKDVVWNKKLTYEDYIDISLESLGKKNHSGFAAGYHGEMMSFKGQIEKVNKEYICFKRIYINGMYSDGICFSDKEDHVWMSRKGFERFAVGDCLAFEAEVYRYIKTGKGRQLDYGLRNPWSIRKIDNYKLPTDKELYAQALQDIVCETCLFTDHCDRVFCIKKV